MKEKITWVLNTHKNELHRVVEAGFNQPAGCQFSEIPEEHKRVVKRAKDALQPGRGKKKADACAYCTKKFKSRR